MLQSIFEDSTDRQYFFDDEEMCWIHGTLLCKKLGFSNPSAAIQLHTDEDERQRIDLNGKSTWFVSEPGVWGLILAAKTSEALEFKRELKHAILPKLRASRGYIMPSATGDQVQALVAEYEKENADLRRQVLSYERGMRSIDGFVDECLEIQKDTKSNAYFEEIYGVYVHHCKGLHKPPVDARDLYNILRQRLGVEYAWKDVWTGIAIAPRYREVGHESPRLFQYN